MRSVEAFSQSYAESPTRPPLFRPPAPAGVPGQPRRYSRHSSPGDPDRRTTPNAMEPGLSLRQNYALDPGFVAFQLARRTRTVTLMVPV